MAARFDDASGWTHTWVNQKNGNRWSCHGLRDAFLQYRWNGEAWAGTKTALDALRCELREAVKTEDVNRVVTVCENILKWGGAAAHNVRYLHRRQPVLVRELQHLHDLLSRTARRRSAICAANPTMGVQRMAERPFYVVISVCTVATFWMAV